MESFLLNYTTAPQFYQFEMLIIYFQWDPMITTLPGLYLVSVGLLKPMAQLIRAEATELCTTFWLRCTNVVFSVGSLYLLWCLLWKLHHYSTKVCVVYSSFSVKGKYCNIGEPTSVKTQEFHPT